MTYTSETREEFFRDEWDLVVKEIADIANASPYLQPPQTQEDVMYMMSSNIKLAAIIMYMAGIINDDQAEIASLKAIAKAKGAH